MTDSAGRRDDLLLWHCLAHVPPETGCYIDIGATDPEFGSLTRPFHDHGWRGVNLVSSPTWFARFQRDRPRDVNIQASIADPSAAGSAEAIAVMTELFERYAPTGIHFARIGIAERMSAVLRGMDFSRVRPWVVIVETSETDAPARPEWQRILADADYTVARIDAGTHYHIAREHPELPLSFASPDAAYTRTRELHRMATLEARLLPASTVNRAG